MTQATSFEDKGNLSLFFNSFSKIDYFYILSFDIELLGLELYDFSFLPFCGVIPSVD